jgi:hypothetical protein
MIERVTVRRVARFYKRLSPAYEAANRVSGTLEAGANTGV